MSKQKKIYFILGAILIMVFFSMTAMAAVMHTTKYWSIPDGNQRSNEQRWTAGITSTDWYVRTSANTVNDGAEDTYYKVAISATGGATSQVKCNLGYLVQRDVRDSISTGDTKATFAWRVDSTLNTEIVDGVTKIYSR